MDGVLTLNNCRSTNSFFIPLTVYFQNVVPWAPVDTTLNPTCTVFLHEFSKQRSLFFHHRGRPFHECANGRNGKRRTANVKNGGKIIVT